MPLCALRLFLFLPRRPTLFLTHRERTELSATFYSYAMSAPTINLKSLLVLTLPGSTNNSHPTFMLEGKWTRGHSARHRVERAAPRATADHLLVAESQAPFCFGPPGSAHGRQFSTQVRLSVDQQDPWLKPFGLELLALEDLHVVASFQNGSLQQASLGASALIGQGKPCQLAIGANLNITRNATDGRHLTAFTLTTLPNFQMFAKLGLCFMRQLYTESANATKFTGLIDTLELLLEKDAGGRSLGEVLRNISAFGDTEFFIGDLDGADASIINPLVMPEAMIRGRQGVYIQVYQIDGFKLARKLFADLGPSDWLEKLSPVLHASVLIPIDVAEYGPSLAVTFELQQIPLVERYAELRHVMLSGLLDSGKPASRFRRSTRLLYT